MKLTTHLVAAVAVSALCAGAAAAQETHSTHSMTSGSTATVQTPVGDAHTSMDATVDGSVSTPSMSVDTSTSAMGAVNPPAATPLPSGTLGDPNAMKAGDPGVVSNGPVPDTAENRARYGQPLSRAGRASRAANN